MLIRGVNPMRLRLLFAVLSMTVLAGLMSPPAAHAQFVLPGVPTSGGSVVQVSGSGTITSSVIYTTTQSAIAAGLPAQTKAVLNMSTGARLLIFRFSAVNFAGFAGPAGGVNTRFATFRGLRRADGSIIVIRMDIN